GLLESELFGHEKGSFTGASRRKLGLFELANEGSIYLDEIGELPLALQAKLLHVVQDLQFSRIGGGETILVDTRIMASTNRNLELEAALRAIRRSDPAVAPAPPPEPAPSPSTADLTRGLRAIARSAAREAEGKALREVLDRVRWNRVEAARILKVSYKTLLSKIAECHLNGKSPDEAV